MQRLECSRVSRRARCFCMAFNAFAWLACLPMPITYADEFEQSQSREYETRIKDILKNHCYECHSGKTTEADIDFGAMTTLADVRKSSSIWQKVHHAIATYQMPPKDSPQLTENDHKAVTAWLSTFLEHEALAHAGDPGPVVLRRLNNTEYTYTIRDLTGIDSLNPAAEFPIDGAAGEGFTNVGNALAMSPSMVSKYLDAGKSIAAHAVLLPDRIEFSNFTSSSDWTNEILERIKALYGTYSSSSGSDKVNLQGIIFDTNEGGRLPLEDYVHALAEHRDALESNQASLAGLASNLKLSPKYLQLVSSLLNAEPPSNNFIFERVQRLWRDRNSDYTSQIIQEISHWQNVLWKFSTVGHIGKVNGPKAWQEAIDPIVHDQELRFAVPDQEPSENITVYLNVQAPVDGSKVKVAIERPRLVKSGRPDVMLRDLEHAAEQLESSRETLKQHTQACLNAANELLANPTLEVGDLASRYQVPQEQLQAWVNYLGISKDTRYAIDNYISQASTSLTEHSYVTGWIGADSLNVIANSSDQHVRIPGHLNPHSIAVHPSPDRNVIVGWKSHSSSTVAVECSIQHAHPECGNGVAWALELRRGKSKLILAEGHAQYLESIRRAKVDEVRIEPDDVVALVINPRDQNHSCDQTMIDLKIHNSQYTWHLSKDVSANLTESNPHADSNGMKDVWHFYSEPITSTSLISLPVQSLLGKWQLSSDVQQRTQLASEIHRLINDGVPDTADDPSNQVLYQQFLSVGGPLVQQTDNSEKHVQVKDLALRTLSQNDITFGRGIDGAVVDKDSFIVEAPAIVPINLPATLSSGTNLVANARIVGETSSFAQVSISATVPATTTPLAPILISNSKASEANVRDQLNQFRALFPIALCYSKIVPVDEVVTLTLFHREDEPLQRLMLSDHESKQLDRLWNDLHFVSRDALKLVDAYEQLWQFSTQDANPSVFDPLKEPIRRRAAEFREQLIQSESTHLDSVLIFAERAFRRPLTENENGGMRTLYQALRKQDIPHEDAIRLLIAKVLVAPAFLYRLEESHAGEIQHRVSDIELASRLSYFLWAGPPDMELLQLARAGKLHEKDVLIKQTKRLIQDPKSRRFAKEFFCQWFQILDFDQLDEKSERHFPEFSALKDAMHQEAIETFAFTIQENRSILELIDCDYAFLNEELAKFYNIPNVEGQAWRKVTGVRQQHRGGMLTLAAVLAKQSGASRTSPILRGNWVCEVVLGEKLPKPPKDVPQLADAQLDGLTERQMIEQHSKDPACSKCHFKIDPFGYALENYDAIGRFRNRDAQGLPIDSRTVVEDGTEINGLDGLKHYMLTQRRDDFVKQFNRKLLGYALGRAIQLSDEPLLREMLKLQRENNFSIHPTIEAIVLSNQFLDIRGRAHGTESQ